MSELKMKEWYGKVQYRSVVLDYVVLCCEDEDEPDLFFIHPLTGQRVERANQALQGWSEQGEDWENWERLVEVLDTEDMYITLIEYARDGDTLMLDEEEVQ